MAGRHDWEDKTAEYLSLTVAEFHALDKRVKESHCRTYMQSLVTEYRTAKNISKAIGKSERAVMYIVARYGIEMKKRKYTAHKRKLKGVK